MSQIAYADHNQVVIIVHTQNMADFRPQLLNVITISLLSEFPEAAEILPDLRGRNIHFLSQGMR